MFIEKLENKLKSEKKLTENGGVGYATSGNKLVDANFKASSMRGMTPDQVVNQFIGAFYEDKELAVKWLFFLRDVRGGMGERRSFRICSNWLADAYPEAFSKLLELIPYFGRWDDLIYLLECPHPSIIHTTVLNIIVRQINKDNANMLKGEPISLLSKWMPSMGASSQKTLKLAREIRDALRITNAQYRKFLHALRKYSNVIEVYMSEGRWDEIDFSCVPSRANLRYSNAFKNHCRDRYAQFLEDVMNGEQKMNSGVLFPHDIVSRYIEEGHYGYMRTASATLQPDLEAMWKSLPRPETLKSTLVVSDGSGSMCAPIPGTNAHAFDVAEAMAIYFSETCLGEFKDKYITFSDRPQLVDFSGADSLHAKLNIMHSHTEVASTNIEGVFDLLLDTALENDMSCDEMPETILIISDMEFNMATCNSWGCRKFREPSRALFDEISMRWEQNGYRLPRLVFWNVCSRTNVFPMQNNDCGVALLSGFSPNIVDMVVSSRLDPYEVLVERLLSERYKDVKFEVE